MSTVARRRSAHLVLALAMSVSLVFWTAKPSDAWYWGGYTPCTDGNYLQVHSIASGWVTHFVDGAMVGVWFNGSTAWYNVAGGTSHVGNWGVDTSFDGWISSAWANCIVVDPPPPPPPPPPSDPPPPGYCEPGSPPLPPGMQCP